ncbi:MAG: Minf_1886 family protein [Opitutales bacterium]
MSKDFGDVVDLIRKEDPRYEKGAYYFVRQALDHTLKNLRESDDERRNTHVSGQELLDGIRSFAIEQYGPMAKTLFDHWNIRHCNDFGDIVFNLVEYGVLGKTDSDSPRDFAEGYDFEEAFVRPYQPKKQIPSLTLDVILPAEDLPEEPGSKTDK